MRLYVHIHFSLLGIVETQLVISNDLAAKTSSYEVR